LYDTIPECHKNICEVANSVGISDPMYFSKIFKAYYGVSPLKYKQGETSKKKQGDNEEDSDLSPS
jgi:YesN/AraC family two-component response regulator